MKKTHEQYLHKGIVYAINLRASDTILQSLSRIRSGNVPIYGLIRDIVSDVRFYSVTEADRFWLKYSLHHIRNFINTLCATHWNDDHILTGKKEDFLNKWFADHLFFLSEEEKKKKLKETEEESATLSTEERDNKGKAGGNEESCEDKMPEMISCGVYDCTEGCGKIKEKSLPEDVKEYSQSTDKKPPHGEGVAPQHLTEVKFLKSIDPEIVRLANMIGRTGSSNNEASGGKFLHAGKSDICGITTGDNLNCVLPSEIALLANKSTENIFFQQYSRKRLQVFASASHSVTREKTTCGPIFVSIDTSSSMSRDPELMAKTVALAVAIVAQRQKRPLILINYSHCITFFVLQNLHKQKRQLIRFLSHSYGGGNEENSMFRFLFQGIQEVDKYKTIARKFSGADLLIISDFEWGALCSDVRELLSKAQQDGMRFYAVSTQEITLDPAEEEEGEYYDGDAFYNTCDYRFTYSYFNGLQENKSKY